MISRLLSALITLLGVITLVFFLIHFIPGDPVEYILGDSARPADRNALRLQLGLDQPLLQQYSSYLINLLSLDLGTAISQSLLYWRSDFQQPWSWRWPLFSLR